MNTSPFITGGALIDDNTDIYIERKNDRRALTHLHRMNYPLVIEPRQQGKTSLINHLMCHPGLENVAFVYLDVTTPDNSSESAWYQTLCPRILRQLRDFIPRNQRPSIPQNSAGWREFLCEIAICAVDAHKHIVIALDEIGAVCFPGATEFFSVLRDVYNSRQAETELKHLTFLLAGAFNPRDLIKDEKISPFNIAQRVRLDDFTSQQVKKLVSKGPWAGEQARALTERIHHWTDGQPYLTQLLCSYLEPNAKPIDVDAGIDRLRREDENHLPPVIDRLDRDEKLYQYAVRILNGERIKFYPRENPRQAELELLGVIKEGSGGYCTIRNRIYKKVLMETLEPPTDSTTISYPPRVKRIYSLRINANFNEVWRCLVYTRDQEDSYWTTPKRLWWNVDEKEHSKSTKSATLLLGINRPNADSIYDFNERRLDLFQGAEGWTVIEIYADLAAELQSDPEANKIFDDFLSSFEQMFERLGYKVVKMNNQLDKTTEVSMSEIPDIPNQLYQRLQSTLLRCGPFEINSSLRPLFVDSRISQWRNNLPSANSASKRVKAIIDEMLKHTNTKGENALVLLLHVVRDLDTSRQDICYGQLDTLASELKSVCQSMEREDSSSRGIGTEKVPEPLRPSRRKQNRLSFKLQLGRLIGLEFEVHAFDTPMGEPHAPTRLPYDPDDLIAILKALPAASLADANLSPAQTDALHKLGLLTNPGLVSDVHAQVGQALYHSLFPKEVNTAFKMAWNQVRAQRGLISLQLRFDEDAVALARYPWELIHDNRRHMLPSGAVELTRYISYPEAPTPLSVKPPLRVLYIESRPTNLSALPTGEEQQTVRTALETLEEKGLIILETLSPPTYNALIERIDSNQDHVLHFDGHGTVARRCPACGAMNYPHYTVCQQPDCNRSLDDVSPLGYLAFEKECDREVDWVDSKALEHLLYPSQMRVAVLSACRSGEVRGETLFGGVGPALIQAGVPAVIAMQVPITVTAAARFMRGFYGALADLKTLPAAMTSGRRRLFRDREWFIPALYLRSTDDEGQLFIR